MKVLVVQDDPNVRSLWGSFLESSGHEAELVDTETAALNALQTTGFDLVLLDLCMNGRDAVGVATLATYRNPGCKVVVVSGTSAYSRKTLFAMSPAVAAALRKPVNIEDLMGVCERVGGNLSATPVPVLEHSAVAFRQ